MITLSVAFDPAQFAAVSQEIGLRKVMGAKRLDIIWLMLRQFSLPILIANAIAWPLSWHVVSDWITAFHYRIDPPPSFAVAALFAIAATIAIAWVTVAGHAWRVARANPIHALKYE